jgi:hypothetical protein
LLKLFETMFFAKRGFFYVFEVPPLRNTRKRDKTKKVEGKLTSKLWSILLGKAFDMDFLQKYFCGVFALPLPRNAQKERRMADGGCGSDGGWWVWVVGGWDWDLAHVRGGSQGPSISFLPAPRQKSKTFSPGHGHHRTKRQVASGKWPCDV